MTNKKRISNFQIKKKISSRSVFEHSSKIRRLTHQTFIWRNLKFEYENENETQNDLLKKRFI